MQGEDAAFFSLSLSLPLSPPTEKLRLALLSQGSTVAFEQLQCCVAYANAQQFKQAEFIADELQQLAWEKLHEGNWKEVNMAWRELYAHGSLIKALCLLRQTKSYKEALSALDLALLMAGPAVEKTVGQNLHTLISDIQRAMNNNNNITPSCPSDEMESEQSKKRKREEMHSLEEEEETARDDKPLSEEEEEAIPGHGIPYQQVERIKAPSLERFLVEYMIPSKPVIITGAMGGWPALNERPWKDLNYLKSVAGPRTVPIEVGPNYLDPNWKQQLMTFSDFVDKFVTSSSSSQPQTTGYLAQIELFELIPELRKDFGVPDYCGLGDSNLTNLNPTKLGAKPINKCLLKGDTFKVQAWFGPRGTVSPLHHDPYHNLLSQVVGSKRITLYSPQFSNCLYPHSGKTLFNTSQVDVEKPDLEAFPLFKQAEGQQCVLAPGEMLYIPPKYWHHVRSLETSFSVSFWWE